MNLPNYITLLRVILIPFFIDLMIYGYYGGALVVFAAACVTDALDGLLARLMKQKTELGAFLDPMADKLLILVRVRHAGLSRETAHLAGHHRHQQGRDTDPGQPGHLFHDQQAQDRAVHHRER